LEQILRNRGEEGRLNVTTEEMRALKRHRLATAFHEATKTRQAWNQLQKEIEQARECRKKKEGSTMEVSENDNT